MLLRIVWDESDRGHHRVIYKDILLNKWHDLLVACATVPPGPKGFGRSSRLHPTHLLRPPLELPWVVEIVDAEAKINIFLRGVL